MTNTTFPNTRQDIENLKETTAEAVKDISSTAAVHAQKARNQIGELTGHAKDEASDQLNRVQGSLNEVVGSARDYVAARPLASLAIALGIGILIGLSRRTPAA